MYISKKLSVACVIIMTMYVIVYKINDSLQNIQNKYNQIRQDYNEEYNEEFQKQDNLNIKEIVDKKQQVKEINLGQVIHNDDIFGAFDDNHTVIVVQVHGNHAALKHFIDSLEKVHYINTSLVIFCSSTLDEYTDDLIHGIRFVKVMHLYFPFAIALHPSVFPGTDPLDFCKNNPKCKRSTRDPFLSEEKHFWWWQMKFIFENVKILKNYKDMILFLDEDNYVLPDLVYMFSVTKAAAPSVCPDCDLISLGVHEPYVKSYNEKAVLIQLMYGVFSLNIGMAFNQTLWYKIKKLGRHYCFYNDHNWYNSFYYLSTKSDKEFFLMLATEAPRVIPLGFKTVFSQIDRNYRVKEIKELVENVKDKLYPRDLVLVDMVLETVEDPEPRGYWEDPRDIELCLYITTDRTRKHKGKMTMPMNIQTYQIT